jgi:carboxypeptidase Q
MSKRAPRYLVALAVFVALAAAMAAAPQKPAKPALDPVVQKIIELGTADNRVMTWNDYASNRFGGRETGTNAYTDTVEWAAWQFRQFGLDVELDEAGEVPVGFNRGPWFGKMLKPAEKALYFGTPSFTAGTKGRQRGPVVILKSDPFSIPGRNAKPEDVEKKKAAVEAAIAEVRAGQAAFKGAWVLIAGENTGFARDGRKGTPEYSDSQLIPKLTDVLVEAGALGTIQSSKTDPFRMLDGYVASWDKLPQLPDIKLAEGQYKEIKGLVEQNQPVELEFDIRNWFKMGPIKYHSVVATLRGTEFPDEYVVLGGHLDCFSSATGAIDDGSGFAPMAEAIRLIQAAGGKPRRSIVTILFAAEEQGLVGSQAWLRNHPGVADKIVMMINRDGSPSAITGASVPETWFTDFKAITAPLVSLDPRWPFKLERAVPRAHATSPGGTDSSSFEMQGVPTLRFLTQSDFNYNHTWHTLDDLYDELAPYEAQQKESALMTAVVAYGVANLPKPLTRQGVYLADGLYADIALGAGDSPVHIMTTLDFENAPLQTADFVRIVEGKGGERGAGFRRGPGGPMGPGMRRPEIPPIGKVEVKSGLITGLVVSDVQKTVAVPSLPLTPNTAVKNDGPGVLSLTGPNAFALTLRARPGLDRTATALGRTIAGLDLLKAVKAGDPIRSIRILRVGQAARDFQTDDEAFRKMMEARR